MKSAARNSEIGWIVVDPAMVRFAGRGVPALVPEKSGGKRKTRATMAVIRSSATTPMYGLCESEMTPLPYGSMCYLS